MKLFYHFVDGLAYCEAKSIYTDAYEKDKFCQNKKPLISKSGNYMMLLRWKVVDLEGNVGFIDDYISEKAGFKIKNLENALGVSSIFDPVTRNFNSYFLKGKVCACSIRKDQSGSNYGSKIVSYVPIEFYASAISRNRAEPETDSIDMVNEAIARAANG